MYLPLRSPNPVANIKELVMPATEYSPLLDGHVNGASVPAGSRVRNFLLAKGEPGWVASYRFLLLDSYINVLLFFIPLSFLSHHLQWDAGLVFLFSFFAIIPLAKVGLLLSPGWTMGADDGDV